MTGNNWRKFQPMGNQFEVQDNLTKLSVVCEKNAFCKLDRTKKLIFINYQLLQSTNQGSHICIPLSHIIYKKMTVFLSCKLSGCSSYHNYWSLILSVVLTLALPSTIFNLVIRGVAKFLYGLLSYKHFVGHFPSKI